MYFLHAPCPRPRHKRKYKISLLRITDLLFSSSSSGSLFVPQLAIAVRFGVTAHAHGHDGDDNEKNDEQTEGTDCNNHHGMHRAAMVCCQTNKQTKKICSSRRPSGTVMYQYLALHPGTDPGIWGGKGGGDFSENEMTSKTA